MAAPSTVDWRYDAGTVPWLCALRLLAAALVGVAALADEERTPPERPPNPAVRAVAGALGIGMLALGAWAVVFVGGIVAWYLLLLVGTFALLLLWIAVYEG
ncbi:hypothetical protein [Halomarina pelagica]|uniref:hypothetical protein n=1 Tax=Halomarina pelagica TaxID=2961599 RepID=UPI0020C338C6|nr:hypothetical protein [Halomarina sp. BND7]